MRDWESALSRRGIDLRALGIESRPDAGPYFCTPKGAMIFGWAGVDGVHYCFVRGFGETVFAVSPMAGPGSYVRPLARDFTDFLRLLLSCGNAAILDQAGFWSQAQFDAALRENPPTLEQKAVLEAIASRFSLTPMQQPFSYIQELQRGFDYSRLRFPREYYACLPQAPRTPQPPEWKVFFGGNFWGHSGRDHAGQEVPLKKSFLWGAERWYIPAVYLCGKGLVMDLCKQVSPDQIQAFMEKWGLSANSENAVPDRETEMRMDAENPLSVHFTPQLRLNGAILTWASGCGITWNPCLPEGMDAEAEGLIAHYQLDPAWGWCIHRVSFPWASRRKPKLRTLSLSLSREPAEIPGPHFHVSAPGDTFRFTHPISGVEHTLTVQEYTRQEAECILPQSISPRYYTAMTYTLSPELPNPCVCVLGCGESDRSLENPFAPGTLPSGTACIGIIGGADGPTAIILGRESSALHAACSAMHFEPEADPEWRLVFREKTMEDISLELL